MGNKQEFNRMYANPIKAGQLKDSDRQDILLMKQQSYILNRKLSRFLHRKEATVLKEFLPEKFEYSIYISLSAVQEKLYSAYLKNNPLEDGKKLLLDYTYLRKIWTHLKVLEIADENQQLQGKKALAKVQRKKNAEFDDLDDEDPDSEENVMAADMESKLQKSKWWKDLVSKDDIECLQTSNKYLLLFQILQSCERMGEKIVVFSSFTMVLSSLEYFLEKITRQVGNPNAERYGFTQYRSKWIKGQDYLRLDGSTSKTARHTMIKNFNDENNKRLRLFL